MGYEKNNYNHLCIKYGDKNILTYLMKQMLTKNIFLTDPSFFKANNWNKHVVLLQLNSLQISKDSAS